MDLRVENVKLNNRNVKRIYKEELSSETFRSFYYLKEELVAFCRENGLPTSGGKLELTERIAHYLDTGEILPAKQGKMKKPVVGKLTLSATIEPCFVCSEKHRVFFKEHIIH